MATFLIVSKHSPENCPINNDKRIGVWTVIPEHLTVWVYEAPSSESLHKFSMDPDMVKWMAWNTSEIKLAMSLEESTKLLK
jgi:hypothetical protein